MATGAELVITLDYELVYFTGKWAEEPCSASRSCRGFDVPLTIFLLATAVHDRNHLRKENNNNNNNKAEHFHGVKAYCGGEGLVEVVAARACG